MQTFHVTPTNDLFPHNEIGTLCDCKPEVEFVEDRIVVTHNAWDGRDLIDEVEGSK